MAQPALLLSLFVSQSQPRLQVPKAAVWVQEPREPWRRQAAVKSPPRYFLADRPQQQQAPPQLSP